ncbi:MAG: AI-2E family transporter [Anaerolineaceae bacterium]|nr:MAG: AI-2E family transporter [Anaerolineaceae bacterium]
MKERWTPATRYLVIALVLFFLVFVGWQIREIFPPLITAALVAYIFYPFVEIFRQRFKLRQAIASRLVFFISLTLMIAVPVSLIPLLASEMDVVVNDLLKTVDQLESFLSQPIVIANLQLHLNNLVPDLRNSLTAVLEFLPEDALLLLETTSRGTLWFLVIVVSVYYFMTDWDRLRDWVIGLAPANYRHDIWRLYREIKAVWMGYLRGQLTLMTIVAVVFGIIWSIIGLPGAFLLGILAGLFSLIPDVGPFAATALALIVALLEGSTWLPVNNFVFALIVAGLYVVLINIKNIWLRPLIYGRSVHMHEGIVFVSIIAAVVFTGIIGAFIVVPVLASLGVIGRYLHARLLDLPAFDDEEPASSLDLSPVPAQKSRTPADDS